MLSLCFLHGTAGDWIKLSLGDEVGTVYHKFEEKLARVNASRLWSITGTRMVVDF